MANTRNGNKKSAANASTTEDSKKRKIKEDTPTRKQPKRRVLKPNYKNCDSSEDEMETEDKVKLIYILSILIYASLV